MILDNYSSALVVVLAVSFASVVSDVVAAAVVEGAVVAVADVVDAAVDVASILSFPKNPCKSYCRDFSFALQESIDWQRDRRLDVVVKVQLDLCHRLIRLGKCKFPI